MFADSAKIYIRSGKAATVMSASAGNFRSCWRSDGGDGGRGGDVILKWTTD